MKIMKFKKSDADKVLNATTQLFKDLKKYSEEDKATFLIYRDNYLQILKIEENLEKEGKKELAKKYHALASEFGEAMYKVNPKLKNFPNLFDYLDQDTVSKMNLD